MDIQEILHMAVDTGASDLFLVAGLPVTFKCDGKQERLPGERMLPDSIRILVEEIYAMSGRERTNLQRGADDDFSFSVPHLGRFRVNVFRQRGSLAAVMAEDIVS